MTAFSFEPVLIVLSLVTIGLSLFGVMGLFCTFSALFIVFVKVLCISLGIFGGVLAGGLFNGSAINFDFKDSLINGSFGIGCFNPVNDAFNADLTFWCCCCCSCCCCFGECLMTPTLIPPFFWAARETPWLLTFLTNFNFVCAKLPACESK